MLDNVLLLSVHLQGDASFVAELWRSFYLWCCGVLVSLIVIAGMWRMFTKAGKPGWAAIIPIYNLWVLLEIIGRPGWWIILFLIPFVNVVIAFIVSYDLAQAFGKDILYALGLFFFPYVFYILLGFGDAKYLGPSAKDSFI